MNRRQKGWRGELVANLLQLLHERATNKREFIDFLFEYFDFTGDDFSLVIETHPKIYGFVKEYITTDPTQNLSYITRKVSGQFNKIYGGKYRGYEWSGSGISQSGNTYSIADKGVVRLLFRPLFSELYAQNPAKAWQFLKKQVLGKGRRRYSRESPIFLKRAMITVILDRIADESLTPVEKAECLGYLKDILQIRKGVPEISEVIFDEVRRRDLSKIGFENVMSLVHLDSVKYMRKGSAGVHPTNLFVIDTIFNLVKSGYTPAKQFFIDLIRQPDFAKRDRFYDSFELLGESGVAESAPDFIVEVFNALDLEKYLTSLERDVVWDKSRVITDLIKKDWQENKKRGKLIIDGLLKGKSPSSPVLEFIGTSINELAKVDTLRTYKILEDYMKEKDSFRETFKNNPFMRQNVAWLAEGLTKMKRYLEAKCVVELCVDDPDPETHNREETFNYHLKIKRGEDELVITTVRGVVAWTLQQFAASNDASLTKYALEKTEMLLDLDGKLARKLGYDEPDYYVRLQAFVPLVVLAQPVCRKQLNNVEEGLGEKVKTIAFKLLDVTESAINKFGTKPRAISKRLADVFSYIRDLDTNEAKRVLGFFKEQEIEDAYFLYLYFALYREKQYNKISFDSTDFKEKLTEICRSSNIFRAKLARYFWDIVENDADNKTRFREIEEYWKLLFDSYDEDVFYALFRTLEKTLRWPEKYASHKGLLKKALEKETDYVRKSKQPPQLWGVDTKIFQILKDHDDADFLEVFLFLLNRVDENPYYYGMDEWIAMFKSIRHIPKRLKDVYNATKAKLLELYPEKFQS